MPLVRVVSVKYYIFTKVWKVEKRSTKVEYAMKEMSKVKIYEKNSVQSIINERKLLAHLRHPYPYLT